VVLVSYFPSLLRPILALGFFINFSLFLPYPGTETPRNALTLFLVRMVSNSAVATTTPCVDSPQLSICQELVETLDQKPNRVIFSGKPATLTPESEILKSSKPVPARKPYV